MSARTPPSSPKSPPGLSPRATPSATTKEAPRTLAKPPAARRSSAELESLGAQARAAIRDNLKRLEAAPREFDFSPQDFERVRALIYRHAGISLSPIKQDMVYSRLARRLRARGLQRFCDYLDQLERGGDAQEWEAFVNALTTNLTSFFREAHHFDTLAEQLRTSSRRPFKIWCCAASTGEEPYSLAITACEAHASLNPPVQIIASDLDTNVLRHGEQGVYGFERVERLAPERLQRYFLRGTGEQAGNVRVRPELQRLVSFQRLNLLEGNWPLQGPFDAIFCRNVMIYFDKPTQYKILQRFLPLLAPDGLLFAGHSENFIHAADLFRSLGRTVYARADAKPIR